MEFFKFENPWWMLVLFVIIPMMWWYFKSRSSFVFPEIKIFTDLGSSFLSNFCHLGAFFRIMTVICLIIVLARPQLGRTHSKRKTEGLDIMLVIDTSGSMKALDFKIAKASSV